jgi:uncharacterized protein
MLFIDTYELTRLGQEVHGQTPISRFDRLLADLPEQPDTTVSWSIRGEVDARGQRFLHIGVKARPMLECQRCLSPVEWPVESINRIMVVNSESDLDARGAYEEDPDDMIERIVGSQRIATLELIEDELILGLPYVPKHDVCPSKPASASDETESGAGAGRPSPFAALGRLKKN